MINVIMDSNAFRDVVLIKNALIQWNVMKCVKLTKTARKQVDVAVMVFALKKLYAKEIKQQEITVMIIVSVWQDIVMLKKILELNHINVRNN